MNKRDAMNQIRQFGSKFDRLRNAAGGGGGGRNAPKRPKAAPNPASRKSNVFNEQVRYAWHGALQDLKSTPLATRAVYSPRLCPATKAGSSVTPFS